MGGIAKLVKDLKKNARRKKKVITNYLMEKTFQPHPD
jgi:hypothetical protein